ncbi:MAG: esterase/lipase family protein [Planctomycetaceae bacterium]
MTIGIATEELMRTGRSIATACLCLLIAWPRSVADAAGAGSVPVSGSVADSESPLPKAQGHLRRAREALKASCEMLRKCDRHAVDGYYLACQEAWNAAWTAPEHRDLLIDAADVYADGLAGLLEATRRHGRMDCDGLRIGPAGRQIVVPFRPQALPVDAAGIASVEPQAQPDDKRLSRRHLRDGFGLPVVVRVANRSTPETSRDFAAPRQSLAATAVLRFAVPGTENRLERFAGPAALDHAPAVLDLANPVEIAAVHIGSATPHLAADLSAPLLDVLDGTPRSNIIGFLQPFTGGATTPHLEMLEPHQPGRIPVVFIHGLASDEGTWFDMINELRAWPEFHRRFEPWVFHYPTGAAFLQSSASLRKQLQDAVRQCDPEGKDPAMRNLVLVGHSMGGLHARMQVVSSGDHLWNAVANVPFEQVRLRPQFRTLVRPFYFFEPLPFVNRVVCIATPHRGSLIASLGVGRLASLTVRSPPQLKAVHDEVVRMNPGAFRPEFERRVPTTIDILQPDSRTLEALHDLRPPCWVTMHGVIGVGHDSLMGGRDDCVVSEQSAHTEAAISEVCVPASHTKVHHHPLTIAEVRRILGQHLVETGLTR